MLTANNSSMSLVQNVHPCDSGVFVFSCFKKEMGISENEMQISRLRSFIILYIKGLGQLEIRAVMEIACRVSLD